MKQGLVIVAHPDDETIWMGGKLLRESGTRWTVLSLCRRDDMDRAPKFFRVCALLNAHGFMSDLEDEHPEEKLMGLDEVEKRIEPVVADKKFDEVYTHGVNGEYGHNRHIEAHKKVLEMAGSGAIACNGLYTFDYVRKEKPFHAEPNPKAKIKFRLTRKEHDEKKRIVRDVYGFQENSFECISCSAVECFRKVI